MVNYFISWAHVYIIHFGAWISFMIAASVHKNGVEAMPDKLIYRVMILSAFVSIFSSHAHNHYTQHFVKVIDKKVSL
jgi:hypothetical protein